MQQFRQRLEELKAQAEAGEILLLYEDESEALTHPYLARIWAKKGADLRVQAPGKAEKCVLLGVREAVHWQLSVITRNSKCSADFLVLIEEVERVYRQPAGNRPVVMVLDHGTIHVSGISQRALAERADWLKVEWLPRYAPELNPIEHDWRDLKQHYLANQAFQGLNDLESRIHRAIDAINGKRSGNPYQELCGVA